MSIHPSLLRTSRRIIKDNPCIFCLCRNPQPARRYAVKYRLDPAKSPQEIRNDVDRRNRLAFYRMVRADKLLPAKLEDTEAIIRQFIINKKNNIDPASNARQLAAQYKIDVIHLAYLAIPLFRVPDVTDPTARLPPSQHPVVAAAMLLACSAAKDLTSTLQVLNAVYYCSNGYNIPQAADIARLFTPGDINNCRNMLELLAKDGDAHAMTLHGRFLEVSGKIREAVYLYEKALENYDTKIHHGYPHPMALPWLTPWMALCNLQQTDKSPASIARAKKALEFGALKADDPMAYYELAALQETQSPEWLAYMSKAAASGYSEAMYKLGQFYLHVSTKQSTFRKDRKFRTALNFTMSWKRNGPENFAVEWFKAAALGGHKPSMFEMVKMYKDNKELTKTWLRAMLNEPAKGKKEEWPELVTKARHELATM